MRLALARRPIDGSSTITAMSFKNCYDDATRADSYARLQFANTYYLAYRDLPQIIREHVHGSKALDFGCGAGRSTRFIRQLGFEVVGVDVAPEMIAKAGELDPLGDYRVTPGDDFSAFPPACFDLVTSVFTFDNIAAADKLRIFRDLGRLLKPTGKLLSVVSAPEIYWHEWASFSTKDFPENRAARSGDLVKIITTDFPDRRPTEDILCTDETYRDLYTRAGLAPAAMHKPLATGDEPYTWQSETRVAPWVIYVLAPQPATAG